MNEVAVGKFKEVRRAGRPLVPHLCRVCVARSRGGGRSRFGTSGGLVPCPQLTATDNSLTAAKVLGEWDSVWAFRTGRAGDGRRRSGRADELIVYHEHQCRPIFCVHV